VLVSPAQFRDHQPGGKNVHDGERFEERLLSILNSAIKWEEESVTEEKGLDLINNKEIVKDELFLARSRVVKAFNSAIEGIQKHVLENHKRELFYSKKNMFPTKWMENDKRIAETLDKYPFTLPILNYLFNLNRRGYGGEIRSKMLQLFEKVGGKKFEKNDAKRRFVERELSIFKTDKEFYAEAAKAVECSEIYCKRYIRALKASGIILFVGKDGRNGSVYADGYYVPHKQGYRKVPLLTAKMKKALRDFKPT
jgi:hypothetical protein